MTLPELRALAHVLGALLAWGTIGRLADCAAPETHWHGQITPAAHSVARASTDRPSSPQ